MMWKIRKSAFFCENCGFECKIASFSENVGVFRFLHDFVCFSPKS
jgi:hypothetical protein